MLDAEPDVELVLALDAELVLTPEAELVSRLDPELVPPPELELPAPPEVDDWLAPAPEFDDWLSFELEFVRFTSGVFCDAQAAMIDATETVKRYLERARIQGPPLWLPCFWGLGQQGTAAA
jgi:hypothetical protein